MYGKKNYIRFFFRESCKHIFFKQNKLAFSITCSMFVLHVMAVLMLLIALERRRKKKPLLPKIFGSVYIFHSFRVSAFELLTLLQMFHCHIRQIHFKKKHKKYFMPSLDFIKLYLSLKCKMCTIVQALLNLSENKRKNGNKWHSLKLTKASKQK